MVNSFTYRHTKNVESMPLLAPHLKGSRIARIVETNNTKLHADDIPCTKHCTQTYGEICKDVISSNYLTIRYNECYNITSRGRLCCFFLDYSYVEFARFLRCTVKASANALICLSLPTLLVAKGSRSSLFAQASAWRDAAKLQYFFELTKESVL